MAEPESGDLQVANWSDDPSNPKNFAVWRKWVMVFIVSFSSLCMYATTSLKYLNGY
jgi:hypothetical protein